METSILGELKELMDCFPGSYINHNLDRQWNQIQN